MAQTQLPRFLTTEIGTVWVICKKCKDAIPVWQAEEKEDIEGNAVYTCPWCRKETLKGETKEVPPKFTNAPKFQQPSLQKKQQTPPPAAWVKSESKLSKVEAEAMLKSKIMDAVASKLEEAGIPVKF